jgi:hypothetical protein
MSQRNRPAPLSPDEIRSLSTKALQEATLAGRVSYMQALAELERRRTAADTKKQAAARRG